MVRYYILSIFVVLSFVVYAQEGKTQFIDEILHTYQSDKRFYTRRLQEYLQVYKTSRNWTDVYSTPNTLEFEADAFGKNLIYK